MKATDKAGNPSEETVELVTAVPKTKVPVESFGNLTKEEQDKVKESVEKANPGKTVVVEPSGKVIITDPKTNVSHEISEELVTTIAPPVVDIPEFNGGVNGEPESQEELLEFNGGVNGEPESQEDLPEFNGGVNGEPEVQPALPEFNGRVNGEQQDGDNKPQLTGKVEKVTKRLANTGEAETNTGLAGLGLAVLGSLLAVAKRRKKDEE